MPSATSDSWVPFEPRPLANGRAPHVLITFAKELAELPSTSVDDRQFRMETARKRAIADSARYAGGVRQTLVASVWLLSDLVKQGWDVRADHRKLAIRRPAATGSEVTDVRSRIREQLHASRNEQLRESAVQAFVRDLETRRLYRNHFVSIFSLMRDGSELAAELRAVREGVLPPEKAIAPYLQLIQGDERCEWTGLKLGEVWRYFRHTWSNPYQSIPGRSMMVLVRDQAAPFHPVIGIAAVSSAAVAIGPRDKRLGWALKEFAEVLKARHPQDTGAWLWKQIDERIKNIYIVDLVGDEVLRPGELKQPTLATLHRLKDEAARERRKHYRYMKGHDYKDGAPSEKMNWIGRARMPLFRSKRAEELAELLGVRLALMGVKKDATDIEALLASKHGPRILTKLLRRIKAEKVGSAIAEMTVCGAVPPYSDVLGGKLVAMLVTSPEVRLEYRRRYGKSESVIASSIAGRPVVKAAELVFIGTTSLFGKRPSQYDRIAVPAGEGSGTRYDYFGRTMGVGTFQFSERTVRELELLLAQTSEGIRVNSVFGEGVNPRLRKIRGALELLGLPTNELLQHGTPRLVYGVRLARNVSEYLLGIDERPQYLLPDDNPRAETERIAQWWRERWLVKRAERKEILERVEKHTLIQPIRHGARVMLLSDPEQPGLFQEW